MAPCPSRTYGAMLLTASLLAAFGVIFISADVYLGCVQDGPGPRAVPNLVEASDFVTLERCAARAKARGQTIYGVEYSRECYAGRDKAAAMVYGLSTNCNMKCSGNSSQTCGGRNALSLYQLADYTMPSMDDTAATYQGCFQDADGVDRRMTPLWTDDRMTIGYCAYLAKSEGYSIFGVQFAVECWGAKDIAYVTKLGTATTCNTPCNGDTTQMCGGPMTLGVYSISAVDAVVVPTPTPTDLNITKLGCFKDSGARQVKNLLKASTTMTSKECSQLAYAAGYTVIGIQYTNECWGDTDLASATVLGASTDCTNQCYQAPVGDCGGPLANTIYTVPAKAASTPPAPAPVGGAPTDPTPTPVPAPASAPLSNLNITALGCYADGTPRAMTLITADATMTVDKCAKLAYDIGYVVFALQYSQECWGSSSETTAKKFGTAPAKCTSPCVSDPAGSCGGGMANSLYRLEQPKAAADPVIVTPGPDPVVPTPNPAPVGTPPTTTLNITVLGCWNDNGASRAVPIALKASPTMTVEECANLAWAAKTRYNVFAVQYGGECYAGKNETLAMRYGPANNCNSACYADPAGTCGGGLANSLYRLPYREPLPPVAAPTGQNWTYKGCYQDSLGGQIRRVPAALGTNDGEMTPSKCAELALAQEYTVFALQFGGECFGGNDLDFATELGVLDEERCSMGCSGNPDQTCGGANANRVFSQPPPPIPADVPAYEHLGCFKDDYVPDDRFDPPYSTSRRMWRRLGVAKGMNSWECAKRAKAAGYPLFGITDYEWSWSKDYGYQCWGAFNVSLVTANGPSNGCVNPCKPWPGADMCGGDYAISLYQIKNMTYDQGAGGEYQYLLEMPISAAHIMQNTGQDTFTLIEFRDQSHPISFDETLETVTYMYLRNNNTWKPIKNNYDSSCGQWARMPDGDFMGFSGYFGASGLVHYAVWGTFWYHRHQYEVENFGLAAMPYGR
eukprot:GHRR01010929.1.p1 GENE.GHRR01010929.1~~GHRR01010929.1.p1  ORF type:complete len:962 (+),score=236.94 GHRR01010929.1:64-2949(+)